MKEILLDAYAARSCPVKTHNLFDPTIPRPESPDESLGEAFHGGRVFEQQILDLIAAQAKGVVDLRPLAGRTREERETACLSAMEQGAPIIIDGLLPLDHEGHRSGHPDALIRGADAEDGRPGYHPLEAKLQRILERRSQSIAQSVSQLARPALTNSSQARGWGLRASREYTLLQMSHYWRMLEATGFAAAGPALVAVVSQDRIAELSSSNFVTWIDLGERSIRTFARTSADGWTLRSPLSRYDHEHRFRVHVAELAQRRDEGVAPAVGPIVMRECDNCVWWEHCRTQLHDEAITLRISKSPLDVREISTLASLGIETITDLATTDLEALMPDYLPQVRHRERAESRLRLAAHRARLLTIGTEIERITSGPMAIPSAELEIDLDIESAEDGRTYLWGLLLNDARSGTQEYRSFARFAQLSAADETELFEQFAEFLVPLLKNRDTLVYHYSDYERVFLNRLAQGSTNAAVRELTELVESHFVDLFDVVKTHFFGARGLGLKVVANAGAGFEWRDDDPGGLNSQLWFQDAVQAGTQIERDAARIRVLEYNEDDVRATKALRDWLRTQS